MIAQVSLPSPSKAWRAISWFVDSSLSVSVRLKVDGLPAVALLPPATFCSWKVKTSVPSQAPLSVKVTVTVWLALLPAGKVTVCVV